MTAPCQVRPGIASQVSSIGCPVAKSTHVGFIDVGTHQNFRQISFLQHQVAGVDIRSLMNRKGINNAVERCADIQLAKNVFGRRIGALCLALLSLNTSDFGRGIAVCPVSAEAT